MSLHSGLAGGGPSAHSDVLSATPESADSRRALVEEIKRRGRACVASRNYPDADALYGKGIDVLSSAGEGGGRELAILRANRSLARLRMGRVAEALEDADGAVGDDPAYVKGHWRRGQASGACGNAREALESFERALELEPTNKALKKEVQGAREKLEQDERLLQESAKDGKAGDGAGDESSAKATRKPATTKGGKNSKPRTSSDAPVKETGDSMFTKSDHVRGYKIRSDGKKTSFFDREISEESKKLIGDIAPKKLGEGGNGSVPQPIGAVEGASAWNKAGTWEERDVTPWAKETLTSALLSAEYILPPGSPSPGARATVTKVSKTDGHASYATVRGKKRYIYEFALTVKWALNLGGGSGRDCTGEITFPDVDGTVELGEGYDVSGYKVDSTSATGTGPLLDRFVRDGGLRDSVHVAIDDWVRLFRASY